MRILGAVFSLLAGKLKNFELLLTRRFFQKKNWRMRILAPVFFSKFFGRKIKKF